METNQLPLKCTLLWITTLKDQPKINAMAAYCDHTFSIQSPGLSWPSMLTCDLLDKNTCWEGWDEHQRELVPVRIAAI